MSNDNAIVNIPLSKRGDIDKQIDRYKAEQFAIREQQMSAARKRHIELRTEAKALIEQVSESRMAELGKPHGMTAKQCRKEWLAIAGRTPAIVISVMRKELLA